MSARCWSCRVQFSVTDTSAVVVAGVMKAVVAPEQVGAIGAALITGLES